MQKQHLSLLLSMIAILYSVTVHSAIYSYEFGSQAVPYPFEDKQTDTKELNGLIWTVCSDGPRASRPGIGGIQYGKSTAYISYLDLMTTGINGKIVSVMVEAMCATGAPGYLEVKVDGTNYESNGSKTINLSSDYTTYDFQGSSSGELLIHLFYAQLLEKGLCIRNVSIEYEDGTTICLDEQVDNQSIIDNHLNQAGMSAQLKRSLSSDYWNTFCIPFSLTEDMINSVLGNTEIREFSGQMEQGMMIFSKTTEVRAGIPYLIKPTTTVIDPLFQDITISKQSPSEVKDAIGQYSFFGFYSPKELATDGTECILGNQDYLYKPSATDYKAFGMRACFRVPLKGNQMSSKIMIVDEKTTDISFHRYTPNLNDHHRVFTINGQLVNESQKNQPCGVYIIDGRKVLKR